MRESLLVAVLVVAVVTAPMPSAAQTAQWDRWSVSVSAGQARSGTPAAMADDLAASGWDDTSPPGWFTEGSRYPVHGDGRENFALRVGYRLRPNLGVALQHGDDPLGHAQGYRSALLYGTYLEFEPSVRTDAVLASYILGTPRERLLVHVDAGPALFLARVGGSRDEPSTRIGSVVGLGASLRVWKLRLSIDAQRRYVGDVRYGGYDIQPVYDARQTFRSHAVSFDHDAVLLGIGLSF